MSRISNRRNNSIRNNVLKSEDGRGYDQIIVAIPGSDTTDLVNVLTSIGGVEVLSIKPL